MYSLILDSATKVLYCALLKDKEVLFEEYIPGNRDHAKNIVLVVEKGLKENNLKVLDLDEIICGVGPGSYTGVRMAVTVCKMFASLGNITLKRVSTLSLMASGYKGKCISAIDARRGNSFCAVYDNGVLVDNEALRNTDEYLNENKDVAVLSESEFLVDPVLLAKNAVLVESPDGLVPNYLRITEAERNLKA